MKTIPISSRAKSITALLQEARRENLVLTLSDGSEFILAEIDAFDHEVKLTRQNQQLMDLLDERTKHAKPISFAEARTRLDINGHPKAKAKRGNRRQASAAEDAA